MLGRLATDAETRRRFRLAPVQTLQELMAVGVGLTPVEIEALEVLDTAALNRFARALDQRLRKAVLVAQDAGEAAHTDSDDSGESR